MIHILNNSPKEYDIILNELKNCFMVSREGVLTMDIISEKLNHWYKKIKNKKKKKVKKKRPKELIINNTSKVAISVVSMDTNLIIVNVQRIRKKMTMK